MTDPEQNEPGSEPPLEAPVRLCKDCQHFKIGEADNYLLSVCLHPGSVTYSPVTGRKLDGYCSSERAVGKCGIEGKFWTQKSTTPEPLPEEPF